jgi:hypothetical protein
MCFAPPGLRPRQIRYLKEDEHGKTEDEQEGENSCWKPTQTFEPFSTARV